MRRIGRDPAVGLQPPEHVERARAAQERAAAAKNQLLRLDEKLDFADAAAPEFQIMAGDGDFGMALRRVDLALHRVNVGDGRIVEVFAPDEGGHLLQEGKTKRQVAGHRARLDHRRPFPVLAERFVIMPRRVKRHRRRRRAGIGPQPQVDPQHIAFAGALLQEA